MILSAIGAVWHSLKSACYRLTGQRVSRSPNRDQDSLVIFSEGKAYWGTFRPIVEELIKQKIYFRYRTLDLFDPALMIENDYMDSKRISRSVSGFNHLANIDAPVMLSTTPNIGAQTYPLKKPKKVKNLIHIFHHVGDIGTYRKFSLDYYDSVILVGDFQVPSIRKIESARALPAKKLVTLGLPYLDSLLQERPAVPVSDESNRTILIGSSWGAKGCLRHYGLDFIKTLASSNYQIIIRPHPQSYQSEPEFIQQCKNALEEYKCIVWDEIDSPQSAMIQADLLISDTSSIRFDYAFLYEKPVITLEIPQSDLAGFEAEDLDQIWNDSVAREIGWLVKQEDMADIPELVKQALLDVDARDIASFRDKTIANFGHSVVNIVSYLKEQLAVKSHFRSESK